MNLLTPKDPGERFALTFDFSGYLDTDESIATLGAPSCEVYEGADASPSLVLNGVGTATGDRVLQGVKEGTVGVTYLVRVTVTTSAGNVYTLGALLPVRKAGT